MIFYEWKNSLALLKKDMLLLLLYSWYKLTIQVYKDLLFYFWWLVVPFLGFFIYSQIYGDQASVSTALGGIFFLVIQYIVLFFARPTLEKKDTNYVIKKGSSYIFSVAITFFLYKLSMNMVAWIIAVTSMPFILLNVQLFSGLFLSLLNFFKGIELSLWVWVLLFLLDSRGSIKDCFKAIWHGYKMVFFNVPISIFLAGFLIISYYAIALVDTYFSPSFQGVLYLVLLPVAITLIVTVYIKRVHDQCSLFFGRSIA
ncbi:MAG TPA: hypothetical protein VL201_02300 [Patescibacteria group bacterium]|nr:hypothetical protein [Patescibacteria group bacterium]